MPGADAWMHAGPFHDSAEQISGRASGAPDAELRRHYERIVSGYFASADAEQTLVLRAKPSGNTAGA